jgi:hypothetical protein
MATYATMLVRLNPDTKGYHRPNCSWLPGGAKTDHSKYRDVKLEDLPAGAKPCRHCAPPALPRRST